MTARTTKEAYGTQLTREAFEDPTDKTGVFTIAVLVAGCAFLLLGLFSEIANRVSNRAKAQALASHGCWMVDTLADDHATVLWTCRDGYRLSSADVIKEREE